MIKHFSSLLNKQIQTLHKNNLYRNPPTIDPNSNILQFASNNYLNLANDKRIISEAKKATQIYGTSTSSSRLITGTNSLHVKLEKNLAAFTNMPKAMVFNSGYMANLGVISCLFNKEYTIFSDELNHASIIDGCKLSKAHIIIYKHNDMNDLEKKLKEHQSNKKVIISDGVFSMDGDIVNLPKLIELAKNYNALSIIDDAHGIGVLGKTGKGCTEYFNFKVFPDIYVGTLSKALASEGGFVASSDEIIEYLKQSSRSYIFSTSLPASTIIAANKAIEIICSEPERIQSLHKNKDYFCKILQDNKINVHSSSAIIPIIINDEKKVMQIFDKLMKNNIIIGAIRYPSVEKNKARLRITITSGHKFEEIEKLSSLLIKSLKDI